jgi:cytochrome c2
MDKNHLLSAKQFCLFVVFAVTAVVIVLNSCNNSPAQPTLQEQIADGKELAKKYCSTCHQLPDPSQLDRKTWVNGVLPAMAGRLHINHFMGQYYADMQSYISEPDWEKIMAYYKNTAPATLIIPKPAVAPLKDMAIFSVVRPKRVDTTKGTSATTYVGFNNFDQKIYTGDAVGNVFTWDGGLRKTLFRKMPSSLTGIIFTKGADGSNNGVFTCIGVLPPKDKNKGKVIQYNLDKKTNDTVTIGDSLPRPVQTVAADFNKDGLMDYVVCGFGHEYGGVYLLTQQPNHQFKKTMVRDVPGGEQLITGDFNNDGYPDVMCLFAQADEGIWMFLNDHKGGFIAKNIMHFPAIYGSSSFQLVDFNHDGKPDILYTCGDNSDFSTVLKPYHGIYIFTNQGNWNFKQTYFYHADGASKAIAADFDHDGDLDIAAISFFPDLKYHPTEGFLYLEQTTPGKFIVHEVPVNNYGRWLTMDIGDVYHNGNLDIILGNFSINGGFIIQKGVVVNWDKYEPIIVLKNNSPTISGLKANKGVSKPIVSK